MKVNHHPRKLDPEIKVMRNVVRKAWLKIKGKGMEPGIKDFTCDICFKRRESFQIGKYWVCRVCDKKDTWGIEVETKKLIKRDFLLFPKR